MGMTKRICISQHMSQYIMQLKLTLRIVRSPFVSSLSGRYVYITVSAVCQQEIF